MRDTGQKGGGVSIYVHNTINYSHRTDLSVVNPDLETCFIEVDHDTIAFEKPLVIGCIYRPPGKSIDIFNEKIRYFFIAVLHFLILDPACISN